jgi:hypothetical protein
MATRTYDAPLYDVYGDAAITLSSTVPGYLNVVPGYRGVKVYCASDWKMLLTPRIQSVQYYTAAAATYTDYTSEAIDKSVVTHVPLDKMLVADILYIGSHTQFLGLYFNIGTGVNANAATLDVEYWKDDTVDVWADVSGDSDGTTSGGATLAQDGVYVWTLPTDWIETTVNGQKMYWIRFKPSATLSDTVDVLELRAVHPYTNYEWMEGGMVESFNYDAEEIGGLQFLSVAATPTLHVSWLKYAG